MTEKRDDGGPAHPHWDDSGQTNVPGMSLRDWFAGQALVGSLAGESEENGTFKDQEHMARFAYQVADLMLRERAKP